MNLQMLQEVFKKHRGFDIPLYDKSSGEEEAVGIRLAQEKP